MKGNEQMHTRSAEEKGITREYVESFLNTQQFAVPLSNAEKERYIATAIAYQLNPFKRELHVLFSETDGKRKLQLVVGYEVYIRKVEETGLLDGWRSWVEGNGDSLKAVVEIKRKDWQYPFVHEVYFSEAAQFDESGLCPPGTLTGFWKRMPRFQLKKVAVSQGFRMCFANVIGGIPYDRAELPADITVGDTPETPESKKSGEAVHSGKTVSISPGKTIFDALESYLAENGEHFSPKHLEWIRAKIEEEPTEVKARSMLAYAKKVVKNLDTRQRTQPKYLSRSGMRGNRGGFSMNAAEAHG